MARQYSYVGPKDLAELSMKASGPISTYDDLVAWLSKSKMQRRIETITATYVIDLTGELRLADQHSEHVVCARGQDVLAAGEITFDLAEDRLTVSDVINQSTGYCPEPGSWWAVAEALNRLKVPHPSMFTRVYLFRRCTMCGSTNIVKDDWYECAVCEGPLSREWNYD